MLLLDNSKHHVHAVYNRLEQLLIERYGVRKVLRHRKLTPSQPVDREWIEAGGSAFQAVVSGIGD